MVVPSKYISLKGSIYTEVSDSFNIVKYFIEDIFECSDSSSNPNLKLNPLHPPEDAEYRNPNLFFDCIIISLIFCHAFFVTEIFIYYIN